MRPRSLSEAVNSLQALALAIAHLEVQKPTTAVYIHSQDPHGLDYGPRANLQGLAKTAVQKGSVDVDFDVNAGVATLFLGAGSERPAPAGRSPDKSTHLRLGDAALNSESGDQGINLVVGSAVDVGLHRCGSPAAARCARDGLYRSQRLLPSSMSCCRPRRASSGISSPALLPTSSEASSVAARWALSMVVLAEMVLKPGKRTCPPLATPAGASRLRLRPPSWLNRRGGQIT